MNPLKSFRISLVALALFAGCDGVGDTTGLEGKWTRSGFLDEVFSWHISYTFGHGSYEIEGYPPIFEKGTFSVKRRSGDTLTLSLSPEKEASPHELRVRLEPSMNRMYLDDQPDYFTQVSK